MLTEIKFKCYPEVAHALEWWSQYLDQGEGVDAAGKAAHNILLRILSEPEQLREILERKTEYLQREGFLETAESSEDVHDDVDALRKHLADRPFYKTPPPPLGDSAPPEK